jgi:hypothetical protein
MAPEHDKHPIEENPSGGVAWSGVGQQTSPVKSAGPQALPHKPGITPGWVDITGIVPESIRIDPDLTEGHPGYEESGDSEIIPIERLAGGETTAL